ncbi:hypothetical protein [Priestia koreensis]|nr:hypothetical protein [Priestia koreensis]
MKKIIVAVVAIAFIGGFAISATPHKDVAIEKEPGPLKSTVVIKG